MFLRKMFSSPLPKQGARRGTSTCTLPSFVPAWYNECMVSITHTILCLIQGLVWLERSSPENALTGFYVSVSLGPKGRWGLHTQHAVCLQCQQPCPVMCMSRMDAFPCHGLERCPWMSFYLLDIRLILSIYAHKSSTELLKVVKG